jgi:hypothetical protein
MEHKLHSLHQLLTIEWCRQILPRVSCLVEADMRLPPSMKAMIEQLQTEQRYIIATQPWKKYYFLKC